MSSPRVFLKPPSPPCPQATLELPPPSKVVERLPHTEVVERPSQKKSEEEEYWPSDTSSGSGLTTHGS
ncbi:hypothetical protein CHS0354_020443, partial [Potamilus streckersoni]